MPRLSSIRWVRSQTERLKKAVSAYNRAITMAAKDPGFISRIPAGMRPEDVLPPRTTVAEERDRITTAAQLDARVRELGAILKRNDPRALEVVITDKQEVATRYEVKVERNRETQVTRQRLKEARDAGLHPVRKERKDQRGRPIRDAAGRKTYYWTVETSFERMQLQKKGLALNPVAGGKRRFNEKVRSAYYSRLGPKDYSKYYNNYLDALNSEIPSMHDKVKGLMDEYLEYGGNLQDLFESSEEFDIDYIYPETNPIEVGSRTSGILDKWKEVVADAKARA